jgi:hypothetical protein
MADLASLVEQHNFTLHFISHLTTPTGKAHEEGGRVLEKQFTGGRAIARWSHNLFALERDKQTPDEPTTFRILKERETGDAGVPVRARLRPRHGLFKEVPLPEDSGGFKDETEPMTFNPDDICMCGGRYADHKGYENLFVPEQKQQALARIGSSLPEDDSTRLEYPMFDGLVAYFPNALAEVSRVSKIGNDQHNPGEPCIGLGEVDGPREQDHAAPHGRRQEGRPRRAALRAAGLAGSCAAPGGARAGGGLSYLARLPPRLMQTRTDSLMEALTNVVIGFGINFIANILILPVVLGVPVNLKELGMIGVLFTVVSVVRSYALRRAFDGRTPWQELKRAFR